MRDTSGGAGKTTDAWQITDLRIIIMPGMPPYTPAPLKAVSFITDKRWKFHRCSSVDDWIATTWMTLENITLSERSRPLKTHVF